jgi:putative oxidoreductase
MWRAVLRTSNNVPLGLVRLALGIVMFAHGCQKMLGWFGGAGFTATMAGFSHRFGAPLAFLAICAEFFGGLGLIFGFLTRIAAL